LIFNYKGQCTHSVSDTPTFVDLFCKTCARISFYLLPPLLLLLLLLLLDDEDDDDDDDDDDGEE